MHTAHTQKGISFLECWIQCPSPGLVQGSYFRPDTCLRAGAADGVMANTSWPLRAACAFSALCYQLTLKPFQAGAACQTGAANFEKLPLLERFQSCLQVRTRTQFRLEKEEEVEGV